MGLPPIIDPRTVQQGVNAAGKIVQQGVNAVERGAGQVAAGAVSEVMHLPQPTLNSLYNISGVIIGTGMMFIGAALLVFWLLGESLSGIADVVGDVVKPIEQDVDKATSIPGAGKVAAEVIAE